MWIKRYYETLSGFFKKDKVVLIYGPRRVGKSSLIERLLIDDKSSIYRGSGDDIQLRGILGSEDKTRILSAFQDYDIIFIDEAQRINNIGWGLKLMVDNFRDKLVIATGSSSFRLSSQVGEPLTGRSYTYQLFPLSIMELKAQFGGMHIYENLEHYLIFGFYPEVITHTSIGEKKDYLRQIVNSYLLKDILELDHIRNSDQMYQLLKLLAFQIGKEVSLNELSNSLDISKHTVKRYLDVLEKAFIIKRLGAYSNNLRKEISKSQRYYFYDNGIRNALINNFNLPENRNDVGMLWENMMVMERIKKQEYHKIFSNNYFWRTYDQKEVDLVEERDGKLYGFEFKWSPRKAKIPKVFLKLYPNAELRVIHRENFMEFVV